MQRAVPHFAVGITVWASAATAAAMGFGATATQTTLGQPLNFVASVILDGDETIASNCIGADVYAGDSRIAPARVGAILEPASGSRPARIRVTTSTGIDELLVTVEISVGCTSRVARRFVAFIDPPPIRLAESAAPADSASPSALRRDPQSVLLGEIARNADASRGVGTSTATRTGAKSSAGGRAAKGERVLVARSSSRSPARAHATSRSAHTGARSAVVASAGGARLQLEAPAQLAAPQTAASAPPAPDRDASAPSAVADAASDVLRRERERIEILESGLARLRADSQGTQRTVVALQARLREAESQRYANGLVYALGAAALLFALIAAALWWLRPRQRARARWFDGAASQQARAARAAERAALESRLPEPPPLTEPPTSWQSRPSSLRGAATTPAAIGGLEVTTVLGPEAARPLVDAARSGGSARRYGEVSMEELIDLEQQAEFFVVLGQEEAAIALLDSYMLGDSGKSPLPYLQLLELHQRRGDQTAYERVRESFNSRFHAFAPEWSDDIHFGREIEEYPQTIARLQALWPTPLSAMQALDSLLFRRHAADDTFDFPAYRELLFLYSIARELSGHVETDFGSIDVLLPLEDAAIDLTPTTPGIAAFAVDLDVSSWPADSDGLIVKGSRGRRNAA